MLSGQGWTAIAGCRQFFYARYFDWAVTNSLIVLNLGLIAGADSASIAATIGAEGQVIYLFVVCVLFLSLFFSGCCVRYLHGVCCRGDHCQVVLVHFLPCCPCVRSVLHRSHVQGQRYSSWWRHRFPLWPACRPDPDLLDLLSAHLGVLFRLRFLLGFFRGLRVRGY
mmetsp:Transcript_42394/g.113414  ORF Transcript_42394/g.113414 Transcript_42394/m.113414 type:complete len:167 (-) Transcript_42394:407-907(-)